MTSFIAASLYLPLELDLYIKSGKQFQTSIIPTLLEPGDYVANESTLDKDRVLIDIVYYWIDSVVVHDDSA